MPETTENVVKPTAPTLPNPSAPTMKVPSVPANLPSANLDEPVGQLTDLPNETKEVNVDELIPTDPYYADPLFYEVANFFGLNAEDYSAAKNKLSDIVDYVIRQEKSNSPEKVLRAIRALEDKLQPPSWDEHRYTNVHRYIRLAAKNATTAQAMSAFEKGAKGNG